MDIEELIDKVTTQTVVKLKKSRLMKDHKKSTFKKTEVLLKNYNAYVAAIKADPTGTIKTQKIIDIINKALKNIENDDYYSIIEMFYFSESV